MDTTHVTAFQPQGNVDPALLEDLFLEVKQEVQIIVWNLLNFNYWQFTGEKSVPDDQIKHTCERY